MALQYPAINDWRGSILKDVGMYSTDINLSSAQLLSLAENAVEVVPALGANKLIVPLFAVVYFFPVSVPYLNVEGSFFDFAYDNDPDFNPALVIDASTLLSAVVPSFQVSSAASNTVAVGNGVGAGMVVANNFTGGDWTMGDGAAEITMWYTVFTRP